MAVIITGQVTVTTSYSFCLFEIRNKWQLFLRTVNYWFSENKYDNINKMHESRIMR
jgi:hypothetical protein